MICKLALHDLAQLVANLQRRFRTTNTHLLHLHLQREGRFPHRLLREDVHTANRRNAQGMHSRPFVTLQIHIDAIIQPKIEQKQHMIVNALQKKHPVPCDHQERHSHLVYGQRVLALVHSATHRTQQLTPSAIHLVERLRLKHAPKHYQHNAANRHVGRLATLKPSRLRLHGLAELIEVVEAVPERA